MSWKYSSYTPRDLSSSREASQIKFGISNCKPSSSPGERWSPSASGDPRFCRNSIEPVEHSPLWAKTRVGDNSASVQRLKERYGASDEPTREAKAYKKTETKDLASGKSGRPYGRSLTTAILPEPAANSSRFRRLPEKVTDPDRTRAPLSPQEPRKLLYIPTTTTKLFTRKYSADLSPTTVSLITKDRCARNEPGDDDQETITVVNRATSPSPTTYTVYLRSKRTDFGLEKKVPKPRRRPLEMVHKEVQTDRESSLMKYVALGESGIRPPWSPYGGGSHGSRFSGKSSYDCESRLSVSECRRSNSREDSGSGTTGEFPYKSLAMKPPASGKTPPTSPVKDSEKKILAGKASPGGVKPSPTLDCGKSELERKASQGSQLSSPVVKVTDAEAPGNQTGGRSPEVTIERCPNIGQSIEDVSSMSESSEDETSTDEERNEPVPPAMAVKKSVTNFLQNIPNHLPQNQSRSGLCQKGGSVSPQKGNVKMESGERWWWTEEGVGKTKSGRSVPSQELQSPEGRAGSNLLSPPYLLNRQFSRDKDWLRGSCEDVSKQSGSPSPKEESSPSNNVPACQSLAIGEAFVKAQRTGNCSSAVESGEESLNASGPLRRRDYTKSPERLLAGDLNEQMRFSEQSGEHLRECSVKEKNQKLQNGLGSPPEEKGLLEAGDMSGMISKAKAGLAKSKTKLDIKKSSSRETSPKVADTKSEIELYWRELAESLSRPLKLCDLDFTDLTSDDETDPLTSTNVDPAVPPPPPMLILPVPAHAPPRILAPATPPCPRTRAPAPPPVPHLLKNKKTVKLFWKEVKDDLFQPKVPDGPALIWDELPKVNVDTQKLEYLFESRAKDLISKKQQEQNKSKEVIVLDPKRSNAINIGMTKLPPPRAIKTAILKMDATVVNKEGIEKLLTMLPTEEEKLRIQEAHSANPDIPLGSAEQFLITLASITELEARLRLWAFKLNFDNNEKEICEPLMDLKQGMDILKENKTFRSILATLLSVGNFLNGYDVKGFHIDYLGKVPEVKDTVHKHSLLHHLCLIVMEKFPDSTDLYSEIGAVTRASKVDFDELAANIGKVEEECKLSWNYLKMIAKHEGHTAMKVKMSDFLAECAERIIVVGIVHRRIMSRFHKFSFWLGVPSSRISTTRPNEIFKTISEFALEYRTTRDRVLQQIKKMSREKTRTRGHLAPESNDVVATRMNSKEAKDDDRLKRLLRDGTTYSENSINAPTWRRQRKDTRNLLHEVNHNDEEILDALIKTANQMPSPRLKERRRSRIYGKYCKCFPEKLPSLFAESHRQQQPSVSPKPVQTVAEGESSTQRLHLGCSCQVQVQDVDVENFVVFVNKNLIFFYTNIIYLFSIKARHSLSSDFLQRTKYLCEN